MPRDKTLIESNRHLTLLNKVLVKQFALIQDRLKRHNFILESLAETIGLRPYWLDDGHLIWRIVDKHKVRRINDAAVTKIQARVRREMAQILVNRKADSLDQEYKKRRGRPKYGQPWPK